MKKSSDSPLTSSELQKKFAELDKGKENLNEFVIPNDRIYVDSKGAKNFVVSQNNSIKIEKPEFDSIETHFRDIESSLIQKILEFKDDLIVGCVAWLTSYKILDALAKCNNVQIIVQKEDFLRPDINQKHKSKFKNELQKKYGLINCDIPRSWFKEPMGELSVCADPTVDGVRCVGNHNSDKKPAFPRMHNKFLVFCRINVSEDYEKFSYKAVSAWTGSFNLTYNATYSLENAISFNDNSGTNKLINGYLKEHHQIFCISEKLNWKKDWIVPEFRIGT
ncbi:MAG: hypothetical protein CL528_01910 [Aequorivita sp.]|nr:hypothetical protein [Aequorivita sp.]MBP40504.1 hypothetical protein [Aequorivita sp.]|tara:strand:+ start:8348 stop:9181 length:834 start_codon:yes stop_codon:yes gene_type:complete